MRRARRALDGLEQDIREHIDLEVQENLARGLAPAEARRQAMRKFGNVALVREDTRAVWAWTRLDQLVQDARYGLRTLPRSPGFTAVAILTLALGIGGSTAMFSAVDAVVLRALPFDEHDRLVAVGTDAAAAAPVTLVTLPARPSAGLGGIAPQDFLDWRARQEVFAALAAFSRANLTFREPGGEPEELRVLRVSSGFFEVLRIGPALGRPFSAEHEIEGAHRVAIISYSLWQSRFGAAPDVVSRTIQLEGQAYEIRGVAPADFTYPITSDRVTDVWIPLVIPDDERIRRPGRYSANLQAIGRLRDRVSLDQAAARMNQVARALEAEHPEWNKDRRIRIQPLQEYVVGAPTRAWMSLLLGAVALVLLIVCANVANLMLARATVRDREIAIRMTLGAGRWRIVRQLLIENLILWVTAALVGLGLALWGVQSLRAVMPEGIPRAATMTLDLRVIAVASAAAIGTGLLFGLLPAVYSSGLQLSAALKHGASVGKRATRPRIRRALVVAEIALALVLLVGAGLFIGSFARLMQVDLGFDHRGVVTSGVMLFRSGPSLTRDGWSALEEIQDRVRRIPGVEGVAAIAGTIPLWTSTSATRTSVAGRPVTQDSRIYISNVTPDYHRVMRIPLRAGRYLEDADHAGGTPTIVINEAASRRFFPGEDPIGRSLNLPGPRLIAGVVGDVRQGGFEMPVVPAAYLPLAQSPVPTSARSAQLVVRAADEQLAIVPALRQAVSAVLPDEPLRDVRRLDDVLARLTAQRRFSMLVLSLFGVLGLMVAAVGVYGILAYDVEQQRHEIGIRVALGASRTRVVGPLVRNAATLTALGVLIGTTAAWLLSSTARAFLFQIEATDVRIFAAAVVVLAASALLASLVPVRRAATVDPISALRQD